MKKILLLGKPKLFLPGVKNILASWILRPKHMFPSLATPGNIKKTLFPQQCFLVKGWFPYDRKRSQTIADRRRSRIVDRRRSQRDLFPYNRRRSQTIAEPTVAIYFVQRKCHMYSRVVLAGKSKQTTWRTSRRKFCCKQIYFFF